MTNSDIAKLMYHCGVSVFLNYNPEGSGAAGQNVPGSLIEHFSYKEGIQFLNKSDNPDWISILKAELNGSRPVYYQGCSPDSKSCHAFICDGYTSGEYFHFNWGWDGRANGSFYVENLNPWVIFPNNFSQDQAAVIGIEPPENPKNPDILMHAALTPSQNPIGFNRSFSITTNVLNNSGFVFTGAY